MRTRSLVGAGTWTVDLTHTRAAFAARHLFGQTAHGTIDVTAGTIEVGSDGRPQRSTRRSAPLRSTPATPAATPTCAASASSTLTRTR